MKRTKDATEAVDFDLLKDAAPFKAIGNGGFNRLNKVVDLWYDLLGQKKCLSNTVMFTIKQNCFYSI